MSNDFEDISGMRYPEEELSDAGAGPGPGDGEVVNHTAGVQRAGDCQGPVRAQPEADEHLRRTPTRERRRTTSQTSPDAIVVPDTELAPNETGPPRRKKWTTSMKVNILRMYYLTDFPE